MLYILVTFWEKWALKVKLFGMGDWPAWITDNWH